MKDQEIATKDRAWLPFPSLPHPSLQPHSPFLSLQINPALSVITASTLAFPWRAFPPNIHMADNFVIQGLARMPPPERSPLTPLRSCILSQPVSITFC